MLNQWFDYVMTQHNPQVDLIGMWNINCYVSGNPGIENLDLSTRILRVEFRVVREEKL
jgi:hypothetical protein